MAGVVDGEHAGCGGRGLGERDVGFQNGDAGAAGVELERERKADDAGAGNDDVWLGKAVCHRVSLVARRRIEVACCGEGGPRV